MHHRIILKYTGLLLLMLLYFSNVQAQQHFRSAYSDFKKVKQHIVVSKGKGFWDIGKSKAEWVQLNMRVGRLEKVVVFLNDSFCVRDSITELYNSDYDLYVSIKIPGKSKRYRINIYFEQSKKYISLPYKRHCHFITISYPFEEANKVIYKNNAPLH